MRFTASPTPDNVANGQTSHSVPIGPPYSYVDAADVGAPFTNTPESDYTFGQKTSFAFNPGDTVTVRPFGFYPGDGPVDDVCKIDIDGYLVVH